MSRASPRLDGGSAALPSSGVTGYLILLGLLALLALWIGALVDAGRTDADLFEKSDGLSKDLTMVLIFLTGGFGGLLWFAALRRRVKRA